MHDELQFCKKCGQQQGCNYELRGGCEPTKYCDSCAHDVIEILEKNIDSWANVAKQAVREKRDELEKIKANLCWLDFDYLAANISGDAMRDLMYLIEAIKNAKI